MREIKFRIYNKEMNHMMHWFLLKDMQWTLKETFQNESEDYSEPMQFTGIRDHKGNEIYEGDIVQYKQRNLEAAFGMTDGEDYIEKIGEIKYSGQSFNVPQGFIKELEVVGNIFQNPELLEEK